MDRRTKISRISSWRGKSGNPSCSCAVASEQSAVPAVASVIATVAIITVTCGILGVTYPVYIVCIIKRVCVFISSVTSSSLTTQLSTVQPPRGVSKSYSRGVGSDAVSTASTC